MGAEENSHGACQAQPAIAKSSSEPDLKFTPHWAGITLILNFPMKQCEEQKEKQGLVIKQFQQ